MVQKEPVTSPYEGLGTSVDVLVGILSEGGRMMSSDVTKYADFRTGKKKLRQFLDKGILKVTIDSSFPYTNWYELTDKGRSAAEHLSEAVRIIERED